MIHELGHAFAAVLAGVGVDGIIVEIGTGYTDLNLQDILNANSIQLTFIFGFGAVLEAIALIVISLKIKLKGLLFGMIPTVAYGIWEAGRGFLISIPLDDKIEIFDFIRYYMGLTDVISLISGLVAIGLMLSYMFISLKRFEKFLEVA